MPKEAAAPKVAKPKVAKKPTKVKAAPPPDQSDISPEALEKAIADNKVILDQLYEMAKYYQNEGNTIKKNVYFKAITEIKKCGFKITSGKQAAALKGIGKSIAQKIDQILETGTIDILAAAVISPPQQKENVAAGQQASYPNATAGAQLESAQVLSELKKHLPAECEIVGEFIRGKTADLYHILAPDVAKAEKSISELISDTTGPGQFKLLINGHITNATILQKTVCNRLFAIGSDQFLSCLVDACTEKGYDLSAQGLSINGQPVSVESDEQLMKLMEFEYIREEDRNW